MHSKVLPADHLDIIDPREEDSQCFSLSPWPNKIRTSILSSLKKKFNVEETKKLLLSKGWTDGLCNTLLSNCNKIPLRIFVIDDSGSMDTKDGRKISRNAKGAQFIEASTRWSELCESLNLFANLSEVAGIPSEFRLLNGADPIITGLGEDNGEQLKLALEVFAEKPAGKTPLCAHLMNIVGDIKSISAELKKNGQKVSIIIMVSPKTDGIATDGDVIEVLKSFQALPVWLIFRLCTNDTEIVEFWNDIDKELEVDIDVIDDLTGESLEVTKINSWLTYGEPLHRLREFGVVIKELDLIDEVYLNKEQIRALCAILFKGSESRHIQELPHPDLDWNGFIKTIRSYNENIFCCSSNRMKQWVNIKQLEQKFGPKSSFDLRLLNVECPLS